MAALSPLQRFLTLLDLERIGEDAYRGYSPPTAGRTVFGGQAIAQALVAAQRSVPAERAAHSLHGYFVLAGDPKAPIDFLVERVRDGRSFSTRRCAAVQNGRVIFSLEASFQIEEQGFEHATPAPRAPDPESLPTTSALAERLKSFLPRGVRERMAEDSALDVRFADPEAVVGARPQATQQQIWFRIRGPLPDDAALHRAVLAYLSDMSLLNTALTRHGRVIFDTTLQVASLDHALWFHRPFRADEWLLCVQESPNASGARALTRGQVFAKDGRLIASVAQEGLVRRR